MPQDYGHQLNGVALSALGFLTLVSECEKLERVRHQSIAEVTQMLIEQRIHRVGVVRMREGRTIGNNMSAAAIAECYHSVSKPTKPFVRLCRLREIQSKPFHALCRVTMERN
jgi:hypothetical protein